ncbi:MAG: cellulose biosynthesis cyclic di-GMP-binding regulatory protein BcsB [Vibrio litoralis]|uniref:cellulose biosynthesis cyclic di-GMP-binding regulatory protein BcsB n=1 Tax=Vibrio litoralis TaxID=335972 RepID=UPI003F9E04B1
MWMNNKVKMLAYIVSLGCGSAIWSGSTFAGNSPISSTNATISTNSSARDSAIAVTPKISPKVEERVLKFNQLGYSSSIRMQGSESQVYVGFGSRLDEIISQATLSFDFIPSPALLSVVSHVKVYFNNELMGVVSITDGSQGKRVKATIPLDARLFSNYNQMRFELIGNASQTCSDPNNASIWAEISQESKVTLKVQKTQLNNDLSLLPAPFFDERDTNPLTLPMVVGNNIDLNEIKAAGIVSSYFGSLAQWRETSFPVIRDKAPDTNAIVFITNNNKPEFLKDYPDSDGPYLQVISHPTKPYVKLLVISGRDSKDLEQAVKGLAFGQHLLTGPVAKVTRMTQIAPRQPYDAPNWISTRRPVALSEMVKDQNSLQVEGQTPPPMFVSFRLPPDLFTWQSRGIPFDLSYRYSPPQTDNSGSRMSLSINNQFVQAFNLNIKGESNHETRLRVPLLDDGALGTGDKVRIPAFKVGSRNDLKFEFGFSSATAGTSVCQTTQPSKQYATIDGDSRIDFSGFPHYIEMPNMRAFANSGFPFTRMADLSDTVAVLPKKPTRNEIEMFINMMGRFGSYTGYPAVNVDVSDSWSKEKLKDKDILAIGVIPDLKNGSKESTPNMLLKNGIRFSQLPSKNEKQQGKNWVDPSNENSHPADIVEMSVTGKFAAITSHQSPFDPQHTIVNILGDTPQSLSLVNQALNDSGKINAMFGSVVSIRENSVASFNVGEHYYVGSLPVWQLIMYHFSQHPELMVIASLFFMVLMTVTLWRILRRIASRRVENKDED